MEEQAWGCSKRFLVIAISFFYLEFESPFLGIFSEIPSVSQLLRCERGFRDKCSITSLDAAGHGGGSDSEKGDISALFFGLPATPGYRQRGKKHKPL